MANNLLDSLTSLFQPNSATDSSVTSSKDKKQKNVALDLIQALNAGNINEALSFFSDEPCEWDDTLFYKSCQGKDALERRLRLQAETSAFREENMVVDDMAVDYARNTIGILFHKENDGGETVENSRGAATFQLNGSNTRIKKVCWVKEPATRGGEAGLQILSKASKVMKTTGYNPELANNNQRGGSANGKQPLSPTASTPEQYFDAWNRRDMLAAVSVFAENVEYEDTAFPEPFVGKQRLQKHLFKCADAFPDNFQIIIDAVAVDTTSAVVEWHMENGDDEALPFTQGTSFYKLDGKSQKIIQGIDFIEPAVVKPAGLGLFADSLQTKLAQEPLRWIPVLAWLAYMSIVFFSDGILPGANALQLEARTWEEVLNLSLNFFLVSPLLNLPFSPPVHPMLEGVFNLLLSWAAMFAGFLSDDRPKKPNLFPMFPAVVGMQFLTSAFLLPYLALRSSENKTATSVVTQDELPHVARIAGESRILPGLMTVVGSGSILWFFLGRAEEYGTDLAVRYASFVDLLSIDRVGSSFLVDLAIFALFQGWFIDDDLKRRGVAPGDGGLLALAGKFVPFYGMAAYLLLRPSLPETSNEMQNDA